MSEKIETKIVRFDFTPEEITEKGRELARALSESRNIDEEFEQAKAGFKARQAECSARLGLLETHINNGFEMRSARCRVEFKPRAGKKLYYLEGAAKSSEPVCTEEMTPSDFEMELELQKEPK